MLQDGTFVRHVVGEAHVCHFIVKQQVTPQIDTWNTRVLAFCCERAGCFMGSLPLEGSYSRHRRFHVVPLWFWMHFLVQKLYFAWCFLFQNALALHYPVIVIQLSRIQSILWIPATKKRYRSLNLCHFVVTEGSPRICQVPSFCRGKLELCSVIAVHAGVVATKWFTTPPGKLKRGTCKSLKR